MAESSKKPKKAEIPPAKAQPAPPKAAAKAPIRDADAKAGPGEKDEFTGKLASPVCATWDFLKSGFLSLYVPLLKLNLARSAAYFILIALFAGVLFGTAVLAAGFLGGVHPWALTAALAAMGLAMGLILIWILQTFESAAFILVRAKAEGKPYSMAGALREASSPTFRFVFVDMGVWLLLFSPIIILAAVAGWFILSQQAAAPILGMGASSPGASFLLVSGYVFAIIYALLASLLYSFLTQFWRYGFLLRGRGVIDALKDAVRLIRENPLEVVLFDLIVAMASVFASIPSYAYGFMMYFVLMFVQILAMVALGPLGLVVYFIAAILVSLIALVFSTIAETVCRPLHYMFWRGLAPGLDK